MDTLDMCKYLLENPKCEAKGFVYGISTKAINKDGGIYFTDSINLKPHFALLTPSVLKADWEIIVPELESVEFMEAMEASRQGKIIYCIVDGNKYIYNSQGNDIGELLDNSNNGISLQEILEGKWYIQD